VPVGWCCTACCCALGMLTVTVLKIIAMKSQFLAGMMSASGGEWASHIGQLQRCHAGEHQQRRRRGGACAAAKHAHAARDIGVAGLLS